MTEQQLIRISNAVSGTFRLALDGVVTASIPHNAVVARIASALTALPNVAGPVEVTKEQAASAGASGSTLTVTAWRVAFVSNVGDLPLMTIQVNTEKGDGKVKVFDNPARNEQSRIIHGEAILRRDFRSCISVKYAKPPSVVDLKHCRAVPRGLAPT